MSGVDWSISGEIGDLATVQLSRVCLDLLLWLFVHLSRAREVSGGQVNLTSRRPAAHELPGVQPGSRCCRPRTTRHRHLLSRSRSLRLSIHFNFWASDQIMKPCLIKQHGAKQMGPLVTARKIAPLTQITVESVLMTTGGSISAPNTTDYSGWNYNRYKQRLDINIKMNHSKRRLVRIYFSFNYIITTSDNQHNYIFQYLIVWN